MQENNNEIYLEIESKKEFEKNLKIPRSISRDQSLPFSTKKNVGFSHPRNPYLLRNDKNDEKENRERTISSSSRPKGIKVYMRSGSKDIKQKNTAVYQEESPFIKIAHSLYESLTKDKEIINC